MIYCIIISIYENRPRKYEHLSSEEWYKLHNDNQTPQEMAFIKLMQKIQNPELFPEKSKFNLMRESGQLD